MKTGIAIVLLMVFALFGCQPEPKNTEIDDGKAVRFESGKQLYEANDCHLCHKTNEQILVGPGLKDATRKYEKEWLYEWVRSAETLIVNGDSIALEIFYEYHMSAQPNYPDLTNENIDNIFFYIDSLNNI